MLGAQASDPHGTNYDTPTPTTRSHLSTRVFTGQFEIGRFPVTVGQYERFVEEGGYTKENSHFWEPKGWAIREANSLSAPGRWEQQLLSPQTFPVVLLSWYEASAYCRWLTALKADGFNYRLPNGGGVGIRGVPGAGRRTPRSAGPDLVHRWTQREDQLGRVPRSPRTRRHVPPGRYG